MPTIPNDFVPQVGQTNSNTPSASAPGVTPMPNFAPQQIRETGAALERTGEMQLRLAEHIQNKLDDANVKAAESQFIQTASQILHGDNGYMTKQGADALNDYDAAQTAIAKAKQDTLDSLGNKVQKQLFNQVATQHLVTFGARMAEHRAQQRTQYTANESLSRADSMRVLATNEKPGSKEQSKYVEAGVNELADAFAPKGITRDSAQFKDAERKYRTQITTDNIARLMTDNQYTEAKSLLSEQVKEGNVEPEVADHLRASIQANVERVEVLNKADEIFSPYKNKHLQATDLDAMLKQVAGVKDPEQRQKVESLVKGQFSEQHSLQQMRYRDNLNDVVNYKYAHNGSLKGIDPVKWGMLDAKDRYDLTRPEAQETDLNTWYGFITKPETLTLDNVNRAFNTGRMTKGDFKMFTQRAMELQKDKESPDYVQNATEINSRIDYFARNAGIKVDGTMNDDEKKTEAALKKRIQDDIYRVRADNKGKATLEQVDKIITDAVAKHQISTLRSAWNPKAWLGYKYDSEDRFGFQMPTGSTKVVPGSDGSMYYADDNNKVLGKVE